MNKRLFLAGVVVLTGLALALSWIVGSGGTSVVAAPVEPPDFVLGNREREASTRIVAPNAPATERLVCLDGCLYASVQDAVDDSKTGDVIKVAAGDYTGVQAQDGVTQVVYISKAVTIRGGYTTTNWTTPDPETNLTTLDAGTGTGDLHQRRRQPYSRRVAHHRRRRHRAGWRSLEL